MDKNILDFLLFVVFIVTDLIIISLLSIGGSEDESK